VHCTCLLLTQSGHDPYAASTFDFEKPIGIGSKVVFDRNGLGQVAVLSGIAYLVLSTFSASEELVSKNADVTSGQLIFNNICRMCHSIREGDNRLGPHMRGIIGRKAGSLQNYAYSSTMRDANFVWDEENLDRFIANPDETVPGNNMKPYGGLASAESRGKLIAFLKTLKRANEVVE
jgi:cytochrome c